MKTVSKTQTYARRNVQRGRLGRLLTGKKTKSKMVETDKKVKVTKVKGKTSDLAFIQSLPENQRVEAYKTYRKSQTRDILASTAPGALGLAGSAITGSKVTSNLSSLGSQKNNNSGSLTQNVSGGMEYAGDSRDEDDNPLGR